MRDKERIAYIQYVPFQYRHYGTVTGWKFACDVYVRYTNSAPLDQFQLDSVWCRVVNDNLTGNPGDVCYVEPADMPRACFWDRRPSDD